MTFDSENLKLNKKTILSEKNKKYSYYIYKLSKSTNNNYDINTFITAGDLFVDNPLYLYENKYK